MLKRFFSKDGGEIDWSIIFVVMMLALIGLASLYVAGTHDASVNVTRMVLLQLAYYVVGIIGVMIIMPNRTICFCGWYGTHDCRAILLFEILLC